MSQWMQQIQTLLGTAGAKAGSAASSAKNGNLGDMLKPAAFGGLARGAVGEQIHKKDAGVSGQKCLDHWWKRCCWRHAVEPIQKACTRYPHRGC